MNLVVGAPTWLVVILGIALIAAAVEDALRLRISNLTCAAVLVTALVAMVLHGFPLALWQNAVVCIAILAIGMPVFSAGWLGGGDVKLLAAIGLWLDLRAATGLIVAVFMLGGLIALAFIIGRRVVRRENRARKHDAKLPYGLAIVAGAFFILGTQATHKASNPFIEKLRAAELARQNQGS